MSQENTMGLGHEPSLFQNPVLRPADGTNRALRRDLRLKTITPLGGDSRFAHECDYPDILVAAEQTMRRVIATDDVPFEVRLSSSGHQLPTRQTALGDAIVDRLFGFDSEKLLAFYPGYRFSPLFDLLLGWRREWRSVHPGPLTRQEILRPECLVWLNDKVAALRRQVKEPTLAKRLENARRQQRKLAASTRNYVHGVVERYPQLVVVRIDLGYDTESARTMSSGDNDAEVIKKSFRIWLMHLAARRDFAGYLWRLERNAAKPLHYHCLLLFIGDENTDDVALSRRVGQAWQAIVPGKRGRFFSVNELKGYYAQHSVMGLGLVRGDDAAMRESLEATALFLARSDYYLHLDLGDGTRTFGRGCLKRQIRRRAVPAGRQTKPRHPLMGRGWSVFVSPLSDPDNLATDQDVSSSR